MFPPVVVQVTINTSRCAEIPVYCSSRTTRQMSLYRPPCLLGEAASLDRMLLRGPVEMTKPLLHCRNWDNRKEEKPFTP